MYIEMFISVIMKNVITISSKSDFCCWLNSSTFYKSAVITDLSLYIRSLLLTCCWCFTHLVRTKLIGSNDHRTLFMAIYKHSITVLAQFDIGFVRQQTSEITQTSTQGADSGAAGPQHIQRNRHRPTTGEKKQRMWICHWGQCDAHFNAQRQRSWSWSVYHKLLRHRDNTVPPNLPYRNTPEWCAGILSALEMCPTYSFVLVLLILWRSSLTLRYYIPHLLSAGCRWEVWFVWRRERTNVYFARASSWSESTDCIFTCVLLFSSFLHLNQCIRGVPLTTLLLHPSTLQFFCPIHNLSHQDPPQDVVVTQAGIVYAVQLKQKTHKTHRSELNTWIIKEAQITITVDQVKTSHLRDWDHTELICKPSLLLFKLREVCDWLRYGCPDLCCSSWELPAEASKALKLTW